MTIAIIALTTIAIVLVVAIIVKSIVKAIFKAFVIIASFTILSAIMTPLVAIVIFAIVAYFVRRNK